MDNHQIVLFNILKERTKCILQSLQDSDNNTIKQVRNLFSGISGISDEELESIETVDDLWNILVAKEVISRDDLRVLKNVAKFVKSKELEREIESYEYESSGITKTAKLVIKTGLSLGIGLAVLSFCGENEAAKQVVLEKLVLPPLVKLNKVCEGSVCFVVETSSLSSLRQLWTSYKDGTLKKKFKKVINEIDEVRKLTQGTETDVTVEIDEEEYREACWVLVLAKNQEIQAQLGRMEQRHRHSFPCDQHACADKTQLTCAELMRMKELENREAKKQIANLRQEVNKLKEESAKKEEKLRKTIVRAEAAKLELVKRANEKLLKYQCFKASSFSNSLQMLKIVKDACIDFNDSYHVISTNIADMKQGDEDAKKVVFESIEKYHMAIQYFETCLDTVLEGSEAREISVYGNLGNVFRSLSNHSKAMESYEKALKIAENSRNEREQIKAHRNLGILHEKLNEDDDAIQHHEKQLEIALKFGDKMGEVTAYKSLGAVYLKLKMYGEALKCYEKFLIIATENTETLTRRNRKFEKVCKQVEKEKDAIKSMMYFEKRLRNATERKDNEEALERLGESYEQLEKYEKVAQYYTKYIEMTHDTIGKANALESLGNAYNKLGKNNDALKAFNHCLSIAKEINDKEIEANVLGSMKEIYFRMGKWKEAIDCGNQRNKLMEEYSSPIF